MTFIPNTHYLSTTQKGGSGHSHTFLLILNVREKGFAINFKVFVIGSTRTMQSYYDVLSVRKSIASYFHHGHGKAQITLNSADNFAYLVFLIPSIL